MCMLWSRARLSVVNLTDKRMTRTYYMLGMYGVSEMETSGDVARMRIGRDIMDNAGVECILWSKWYGTCCEVGVGLVLWYLILCLFESM